MFDKTDREKCDILISGYQSEKKSVYTIEVELMRPASMWNETVERDGKVYQRFTFVGEE